MLQKRANLFSPLKLFFNTYSFFSANLIWAKKKNHPNPPKIQGEQSIIIFLPLSRYQVLQNVVYEIKFFVVAMFLFLRQMSLKWVKFKKWHLVEGLWSQVFLKSAQPFLRYGHFWILALKWGQNWGDEKKSPFWSKCHALSYAKIAIWKYFCSFWPNTGCAMTYTSPEKDLT